MAMQKIGRKIGLALCMAGIAFVTEAVFTTRAQAINYSFSVTGAKKIHAGYDGYVEVVATFDEPSPHLYFNEISVPAGLSYELSCINGTHPCWADYETKRRYVYGSAPRYNEDPFMLRLSAAAATTPGIYTVRITTDGGGIVHSIDIPIEVLPSPTFTPTPPAYSPPIPGLKKWEDTMGTLGKRWCDPNKVYGFGWEADVWYYDGARVYFQMADYTGDSSWEACAFTIARQYRDAVLQASNGWGQGWRVFPHGLRMAYERSGDESYKQAAMLLATKSAFAESGGRPAYDFNRETAYIVEAYIQAEKLGAPRNPVLARAVNYLLGDFEGLLDRHEYTLHQTFCDGLMAEALIEYYELTHDARIPPVIRKLLDWTWSTGWDHHTKQLVYNPDTMPREYFTELNNLLVPAFAWYYSVTGDAQYQRRGDELFAHALDTDISWSGKIFSQNYRWSFAYVKWRRPTPGGISVVLPEWIPGGQNMSTEVILSEPAAVPCGQQVALTSSDPAVLHIPRGVVLKGGGISRSVGLTTDNVGQDTPVEISAWHKNGCGQVPVTRTTAVAVGPARLRLVLNTALQYAGTFANNRIFLDGPARPAEASVTLGSSHPDLVKFLYNGQVVSSVPIEAGKTESDYFLVRTGYVSQPTTVTVTATANGMAASSTFQVYPPKFRAAFVGGGLVMGGAVLDLGEVVLEAPAPAGGKTVALASLNTSVLNVPATVTVPEGAISAGFTYTTTAIPSFTGVVLRATCDDKVMTAVLNVDSLALGLQAPGSIKVGETKTATLLLSSDAPGDLVATFTASDATVVALPAAIVIRKGMRKGEFTITGQSVGVTTVTTQVGALTAKATLSVTL